MTSRPEANCQEGHRAPTAAVAAALHDGKKHLLLAASGSVATIKLPLIISSLANHPNLSIRVILTKSAARFLAGQSPEQPTVASLSLLPNVDSVLQDEDEWFEHWKIDAKILHIELRRWGLCDDLLTNVIRAWDIDSASPKRAITIAAPSMNSMTWAHPLTGKQIAILDEERGWFEVLPPQVKSLACGDIGQGGMCDWKEIFTTIEKRLAFISLGTTSPPETP